MRRLFRQFSFPGGIPSHVAPETPGSIHEGGELGYALVARLRRRVRQPRPARAAASSATARPRPARWPRAGTRTSSSTRRATARCCRSCTSTATRSPTRPCSPGSPRTSCARCSRATATRRVFVERRRPGGRCTSRSRRRSTSVAGRDRARSSERARERRRSARPRWPMIVLRTPKGWTGPKEVDGLPVEGTFRAHQVPLAERRRATPSTSRSSRTWMRSYRPEELFDEHGALRPELAALAPDGRAADGREPARQRRRCCCATSSCPTSATTRSTCPRRRPRRSEATRVLGAFLRDVMRAQPDNVPHLRARRDGLQPARRGVRGDRPRVDGRALPTATITSRPTAA